MAIPLTCSSCDYEFKVKDELAGKRIKCPKCKEVMTVFTAEEEPEEEERPKKKKKKKGKTNNRLLIGSAIGGGVLLVVLVLFFLFAGGGNGDQKKVAQKKGDQPALKPVVQKAQIEQPEDEPIIVKKAPANAIARVRERTEIEANFRTLGQAFKVFELDHKGGPKDAKEFGSYYQNIASINEAFKNKWYTFIWGTNPNSFPDGTSNTLLAFETDADGQGNRIVLMGDGSVHSVDEATFQMTPKAKGK